MNTRALINRANGSQTSFLDPFDFLFKDLLNEGPFQQMNNGMAYPMNCGYDTQNVYFEFSIVGGDKENISISKSPDEVKVTYHPQNGITKEGITWEIRKIAQRGFEYSIKVSPKWDIDNITSSYIKGLLRIIIPLKKAAIPQIVEIN